MQKTIRTGVYALCKHKDKIVAIEKRRGPFIGLLDLPGGKIEHGENHRDSLKRELSEELGLKDGEYNIKELLSVEEDFVEHMREGEKKSEHIIAIGVYCGYL